MSLSGHVAESSTTLPLTFLCPPLGAGLGSLRTIGGTSGASMATLPRENGDGVLPFPDHGSVVRFHAHINVAGD